MTRIYKQVVQAAPSDAKVDALIGTLKRDPDRVIELVVAQHYFDVLQRYQAVTGETGNPGKAKLTAKLQALRKQNGLAALYCISVPFDAPQGTTLGTAVTTLRSEMSARLVDPSLPLKMGIYPGGMESGGAPDFSQFDNSLKPTGSAGSGGGGGTGSSFWNSLPGILTAAGGLVGAFTGNVAAPAPSTSNPAPRSGNSLITFLVVGILIIVTIAGVVYFIRRK